jgi:hypothetical protein
MWCKSDSHDHDDDDDDDDDEVQSLIGTLVNILKPTTQDKYAY